MKFLPTITAGIVINCLGVYLAMAIIACLLNLRPELGCCIASITALALINNFGDSESPLIL